MGCCFSRPHGPNSPYPGGAHQSGSARAINAPAPFPSPAGDGAGNSSATPGPHQAPMPPHRGRHGNEALDQHINKPLRLVPWTSRSRRWTREMLDREREAFFDTRVTGREEIWQTVRAAVEVLQGPAETNQGLEENIAMAQSILTAAEITLPSGNLTNGVYDSLGNYYSLPEWVVSDPTNIIDSPSGDGKRASFADNPSDDEGDGKDDGYQPGDDLEAERRREKKGKAVVDLRDQITVKARLSENAQDVKVNLDKRDTVKVLARKILVESGLPSNKRIRIAYMGKILKENVSLLGQGFEQGHVVNALVFTR